MIHSNITLPIAEFVVYAIMPPNKLLQRDASTDSLSSSSLKFRLKAARSARLNSGVRCLRAQRVDFSELHPLPHLRQPK